MTISDFCYGLFSFGIVGLGAYAFARRLRSPVKFKSFDEMEAVRAAALWARQQIGPADPRKDAINTLFLYFGGNDLLGVPYFHGLSKKEIELLAPFIEDYIAGRGPRQNLPAEYEDWRPAALRNFKARMKAEGLWPENASS
jgi:hypothetical protein